MLPGNRQRRRICYSRVARTRRAPRSTPTANRRRFLRFDPDYSEILTTTPPYATPDAATRPAVVGTTHASERPPSFSAAWRARRPSRVRRAQCVVAAAWRARTVGKRLVRRRGPRGRRRRRRAVGRWTGPSRRWWPREKLLREGDLEYSGRVRAGRREKESSGGAPRSAPPSTHAPRRRLPSSPSCAYCPRTYDVRPPVRPPYTSPTITLHRLLPVVSTRNTPVSLLYGHRNSVFVTT